MKRELIITALQKKMGAGSDSMNVLLHKFKRDYPLMHGLATRISKAELSFGTANEISDKEVLEIVELIKKA